MKVFISQWAKDSAHNLDMQREAWISRKSKVKFVSRELLAMKIDSDLNHLQMLDGTYKAVLELYNDARHDRALLSVYLSRLNAEKTIDGQIYQKSVFFAYRKKIIAELKYKELLCSVLNDNLKYRRMFVSDSNNPRLLEIFGDTAYLLEDDYLSLLYELFKKKMREAHGRNYGEFLTDEDRKILDMVNETIQQKRAKAVM